jgi:hypothetical protein
MADKQTTRPHGDGPGHGSGHSDRPLQRPDEIGRPNAPGVPGAGASDAEVTLAMSDLIADDRGEIVFFNDSDLRRLVVTSDAAVVAEGRSGAHRTSAGEDVGGFSYVTFDNGVTLYFRAGLDLVVRAASA